MQATLCAARDVRLTQPGGDRLEKVTHGIPPAVPAAPPAQEVPKAKMPTPTVAPVDVEGFTRHVGPSVS